MATAAAGTGARQEDQIITVALQKATGKKMIYIPQAGGGAVAVQLVGTHIDSSVNNPTPSPSTTHSTASFTRKLLPKPSPPSF